MDNIEKILGQLKADRDYVGREIRRCEIDELVRTRMILGDESYEYLARKLQMPLAAVSYVLDRLLEKDGEMIGGSISAPMNWKRIIQKARQIFKAEIPLKPEFDQCRATLPSVLSRIRLLWERLDIQGKRVLILGDDDLTSVLIGLTRSATEVSVIEIDNDLAGHLLSLSKKYSLHLRVHRHDYTQPLPRRLRDRFDTVFADPPYTLSGLDVCLERATEALKHEEGRRIYLCYSPMDLSGGSLLALQRKLYERGLVYAELIPHFNHYHETTPMRDEVKQVGYKPMRGWFTSSILRVSTTRKTWNGKMIDKEISINIYEYEKQRR